MANIIDRELLAVLKSKPTVTVEAFYERLAADGANQLVENFKTGIEVLVHKPDWARVKIGTVVYIGETSIAVRVEGNNFSFKPSEILLKSAFDS